MTVLESRAHMLSQGIILKENNYRINKYKNILLIHHIVKIKIVFK